ncbi:MAG: TonB family protein [Proteobacteria bacterium]|nr:TonB family protein [Pseudomonadota bacterium]
MDYAEQQRSPVKHLTGLAVVLLFHIVVGYALVNGLARKMVEVIKSPMETKIIEEASKLPEDTPPPPPPKLVPLPPAFVPPPEVQIQAPATPQPTISNTTSVVAPVRSVLPPAPVMHAPPSVGVACPNSQKVRSDISYPASAKRDELEGNVLIEFTVAADGSIKDIEVKSSSDRIFNNVSINAVRQFKCNAQGRDVRVSVPFVFKLVN